MRYRLSDKQLERLLEASKPTRVMYIPGGIPIGGTPQENANAAWRAIAAEHGCAWNTIKPANTGDQRDFDADPLPGG